jgi:probable phosphoglycerate mutase
VRVSARATRFFLIRHGEVESAWQGRVYGSLDVPLSDRGLRDGSRVASDLSGTELAAVVSSGLGRTEHMAACLRTRRALPRIDDPGLRELERGAWAGLSMPELEIRWPGAWAAWFADPATARPPGGESLDDLFERVRPRLDHWASQHPGGSIALVTHGWVVRVLVSHVIGAPFLLAPRLDVRTGDITVIRWPTGQPSSGPELEGFALGPESPQLSE